MYMKWLHALIQGRRMSSVGRSLRGFVEEEEPEEASKEGRVW